MIKLKIFFLSLIPFFIFGCGSTSFHQNILTWEGSTISQFLMKTGYEPKEIIDDSDGSKIYMFREDREETDYRLASNCRWTFLVDKEKIIKKVSSRGTCNRF